MAKKIERAVAKVQELISNESDPRAMSQEEALEFYQDLVDDLESRIEGVKADLKAQG